MFEDRPSLTIRTGLFAALVTLPLVGAACGSDAGDLGKKTSEQEPSGADDDSDDDTGDDSDDDSVTEEKPTGKVDAGKVDAGKKDGGTAPVGNKGPDAGGTKQAGLPCDVAKVLETHCAECHGDPADWGAPMSLVDHDDFTAMGAVTKTQKVDALVKTRINDKGKPMPPTGKTPMTAAEKATLETWISAGAPAGKGADSCIVKTPEKKDDVPGKPNIEGMTCYELRNHGKPMTGDKSKYAVKPGEHYAEFFFDAPWKEPSLMVGFRTLADDSRLLHHWLMYKTNGTEKDGTISEGIGSHIGGAVQLLAGWAVGGNDISIPDGIGAWMPPPGGKMMVEWHYYNQTNAMQMDQSGVEVCVVPVAKIDPKKVASITWVGNENLGASSLLGVIGAGGMPPMKETKIQDTCTPKFAGLPAGEPIRIFSFTPHMHKLGRHMRTWIARKDGKVEKIFDHVFQFDQQDSYKVQPMIEVFPGDKLVNECTFFNDTTKAVGFGPSSDQEMCYQFTYAYPSLSLVNGVSSLTGATNTCWDNKPAEAATLIGKSSN